MIEKKYVEAIVQKKLLAFDVFGEFRSLSQFKL